MKNYTDEIIGLLEEYSRLSEKIGGIKSSELLRENDNYRNLLRIESELKNYVLNGEEIIKVYSSIKEKTKSESEGRLETSLSEITNDLENITSNKKGTTIDEINEVINKYKKGYEQS